MNLYRFDLYITNEDIYKKLEPNQKEQIGNILITNVQLCGNDGIHIECIALEKGIELSKEPTYRQNLMDNEYITAF